MPWRRLAPGLVLPGVVLALNLFLFVSERLDGEPLEWGWYLAGPIAWLLWIVCAVAIVVLIVASSAIQRAGRLAMSGVVDPFAACRYTYRLAAGSAAFGGTARAETPSQECPGQKASKRSGDRSAGYPFAADVRRGVVRQALADTTCGRGR